VVGEDAGEKCELTVSEDSHLEGTSRVNEGALGFVRIEGVMPAKHPTETFFIVETV